MRADVAYTKETWLAENITGLNVEQINQLRVDRLMAKARYFYNEWEQSDKDYADYECIDDRIRAEKSKRIAEAYKDRANKIKEGM